MDNINNYLTKEEKDIISTIRALSPEQQEVVKRSLLAILQDRGDHPMQHETN